MATRVSQAKARRAFHERLATVAGIERVLWPLDGDPDFPDSPAAPKHWIGIIGFALKQRPRAGTSGCDVQDLTVQLSLLTVQPRSSDVHANATKVDELLVAVSETGWAASDGQHIFEMTAATAEMAGRDDLIGKGMASVVTLTGTVKRAGGLN